MNVLAWKLYASLTRLSSLHRLVEGYRNNCSQTKLATKTFTLDLKLFKV